MAISSDTHLSLLERARIHDEQVWQQLVDLYSPTVVGWCQRARVGPEDIQSLMSRAIEQIQGSFEARTWQAFWRTTVDGIPTAVIAQELGLSLASVRQARSRVLRRLRQQLGDFTL